MGIYVNPGNKAFVRALNSEIYIDKTDLITVVNNRIDTMNGYLCVSRPRRFGKSMAADMLTAYYSRGCNSAALFEGRKAKTGEAFQEHLNRHHVIRLDIQKFLETTGRIFWFYRRRGQRIVCSEKNGFKEIIQECLRAVKVGGWEGHEKGKETERSDKELWRNYM